MNETIYTFTDIETSGLDKLKCEITQLAAVATDSAFNVLGQFNMLTIINESIANPKALEIGHYDPERWAKEAIPFKVAAEEMRKFLNQFSWMPKVSKGKKAYEVALMAGHNVRRFDGPFMNHHFKKAKVFYGYDAKIYFDTMEIADLYSITNGVFFPDRKHGTLCDHFGVVNETAHDALSDCLANIELTKHLMGGIRNSGINEKIQPAPVIDNTVSDVPPLPISSNDIPNNPLEEVEVTL